MSTYAPVKVLEMGRIVLVVDAAQVQLAEVTSSRGPHGLQWHVELNLRGGGYKQVNLARGYCEDLVNDIARKQEML